MDGRQRVLILGGGGMLGMALIPTLSRYYRVSILDNFSRYAYDGNMRLKRMAMTDDLLEKFDGKLLTQSITNDPHGIDLLDDIMQDYHWVINCAADVGGVFYNESNQASVFNNNAVLQSVPVLAAQWAGVENFIQVSSVCVYSPHIGIVQEGPRISEHRETNVFDDSVFGSNLGYSLAKRAGEIFARHSGIKRIFIIRPTNMYGPYDHYDERAHVIPSIIRQAVEGNRINVRSAPQIERDFLYVGTAAEYIARLMRLPASVSGYRIFNLPATFNGRKTIGEVVDSVVSLVGGTKATEFIYDEYKQTEISRRVNGNYLLETLREHNLLDGFEEVDFDTGLEVQLTQFEKTL